MKNKTRPAGNLGVWIALIIYALWLGHLVFTLAFVTVEWSSFLFWAHILLQGYLFTGLFITGHDAMHGTVSRNRRLNDIIGWVSTLSFAFLSYDRLRKNHYLHHQFPASAKDPDFHPTSNNVLLWWVRFMIHYTTWWQLVLMAVTFNVLLIWFSVAQLLMFWVVPAFLGTFQLFVFGTFIPHRRPHTELMGIHRARTLTRNHWIAMLTCYFFGYHREHHIRPTVPWWKLYSVKDPEFPVV
jgi:beta-carotene ketolase (CrtW type)